jgi:hypothetical protein
LLGVLVQAGSVEIDLVAEISQGPDMSRISSRVSLSDPPTPSRRGKTNAILTGLSNEKEALGY